MPLVQAGQVQDAMNSVACYGLYSCMWGWGVRERVIGFKKSVPHRHQRLRLQAR